MRNKRAATPKGKQASPLIGHGHLRTALDDRSRPAYKILADEKKETAAGFWQLAHAYFTASGITVERVISDNGSCHRSRLGRDALPTARIRHKRTRPYRPRGSSPSAGGRPARPAPRGRSRG